MTEESRANAPASRALPESPSLDWLRKQAKRRLAELRQSQPEAQLADAQLSVAREYGFSSWRALKAHIDALTVDGQLVESARTGDVETLRRLLDEYPEHLAKRSGAYEWTLLHFAAQHGQLAVVNELLERGADVNAREKGDNTYPLHWAAAAGHLDVVRRLADAGAELVGHGDDHALEVIGWASCWDECDDAAHHAVVDFLVSRGVKHHIFSAISFDLAGEVRRIVAADPVALTARMSRNENNQTALQFAVRRDRPNMVALLLELGADPLGVDGWGMPVAAYVTSPSVDRPIMEAIHAMVTAEIDSADRGRRPARASMLDLVASVVVRDWASVDRLLHDDPTLAKTPGAVHLMAKRGDVEGLRGLLNRGADPSARWTHWESDVTPLHLAVLENHLDVVAALLEAGADPGVRDTQHNADALGWAEFFRRGEIVRMLRARANLPRPGL